MVPLLLGVPGVERWRVPEGKACPIQAFPSVRLLGLTGVENNPSDCQDMPMRIGAFEIIEPLPQLDEPHVVAVLRPWINVGRIGTLVLSRLERHLGAHQLGELVRPGQFFDFTRSRPKSRLVEGNREMTIPNSIISYARREEKPDLLLFNLREPQAFGEDYVDSILEVCKTFGVRRYCLIGGMYDIVPHTRPLLVSGAFSGEQAMRDAKRVGVQESNYQGPTSIIALITQEAPKMGMEHMTFVVHLPQYVQLEEDYAGAARLMGLLCSIYQLPPHLAEEERGQRQYNELNTAVERNPELKGVLQQLENQYDARQAPEEEPSPPLSPEVEKFLSELGREDEA